MRNCEPAPRHDHKEKPVNEIFPVVEGLAVGVGLGWLAPRVRLPLGLLAALVLGVLATVVSGEFRVTWGFVLVDIPLVGLAAAVGLAASRALRRRVVGDTRR
jgi:hypothetical protein